MQAQRQRADGLRAGALGLAPRPLRVVAPRDAVKRVPFAPPASFAIQIFKPGYGVCCRVFVGLIHADTSNT